MQIKTLQYDLSGVQTIEQHDQLVINKSDRSE